MVMKYRILTDVELKGLESEFAKYLVASNISSEEWIKVNKKEPLKAVEIVEHFSDSIFEDVLTRISYLEIVDSKEIKIFKTNEHNIELIAIKTVLDNDIDFKTIENFGKLLEERKEEIDIYKGAKKYNPDRNIELFNMTELGAEIADEKFWRMMNRVIK
jgi:hypothetical protein